MTTRQRALKGQITKEQIPQLLRQVTAWEANNRLRLEALRPDFKAWTHSQLVAIMKMIESQGYFSSVQSRILHVVAQVGRMESGEIVAVSEDGTGFTLAPMRAID